MNTYKDLQTIQKEQKEWSYSNFGDQPALHPLMGIVEELGELFHARLKFEQGIRDYQDTLKYSIEAQDAIGDLIIFLMGFCNKENWDLLTIINNTWDSVGKRDWKLYPKNGVSE